MNIAIIDLGTNSARLFIYRLEADGTYAKIFRKKSMVRLGDSVFIHGTFDETAKARTLKAFETFSKYMNALKVDCYRAVATSAMRTAQDRAQFISAINQLTNIKLEVISGEEEAELITLGINEHLAIPKQSTLLVDIGGGSTEVTILENDKIIATKSLTLGAARCQQLYLKDVPPTAIAVKSLRTFIQDTLKAEFNQSQCVLCIGSSGSIRALAQVLQSTTKSEKEFDSSLLINLNQRLTNYTRDQIINLPHLEAKRADLILAASIVMEEILAYFSCPHVQVTSHALKDGLILRAIRQQEYYDWHKKL